MTEPSLGELKRSPLYSEELDIDLASKGETECFKWFLASLLFGARIAELIARRTYRSFERHGLLTPAGIVEAGWDHLVDPVMREGGYVRYDESKSRQILRNCETLLTEYDGSLVRLHACARSAADLEQRLLGFFGVGPVTCNIFLRELRPHWRHADPEPLPVVAAAAAGIGLDLERFNRKTVTFTRIEAGLIRLPRAHRARGATPSKPREK